MSLSLKNRWEIIFLRLHPLGPKLSLYAISKRVKCSQPTVKHWVETYEKTGDVVDKEGRGRKRKTSGKVDKAILKAAEKTPSTSSSRIQLDLESRGVRVSARTVRRRLNEQGLHKLRPLRKPLLKEEHRLARLEWANQNKNRDWSKVIFTDETSIQLFEAVQHVWQRRGERQVVRTVKHPPKVHIWGCFSARGFSSLYLFTENLDSELMCKIYKKALLPSALEMFGDHSDDWVLQEDNDPKHTSNLCTNWREENGVERMAWPACSPDLNPIENVWGILKSRIREKNPLTVKQLKTRIKKEWKLLEKQLAENLVFSVSRRVSDVIDVDGDTILY